MRNCPILRGWARGVCGGSKNQAETEQMGFQAEPPIGFSFMDDDQNLGLWAKKEQPTSTETERRMEMGHGSISTEKKTSQNTKGRNIG